MGWARGINHAGREIGYAIEATCEQDGCEEKIDLGLGHCCGGLDGVNGRFGCGGYFCGEHLFYVSPRPADTAGQLCEVCAEKVRCAECWEDDEELQDVDGSLLCPICAANREAAA